MRITAVDSVVLAVPTPRPMALEFPEHRLVVAHVRTDEGLVGLGYSLAFGGGGAEAIQVYLETRLKPLLLGEDPLFVARLWERMWPPLEGGCVRIPDRPGHGLAIAPGAIARYRLR
jgi:L-alanine-DL-glutamate epimerase-like enolase superfamily enzyme